MMRRVAVTLVWLACTGHQYKAHSGIEHVRTAKSGSVEDALVTLLFALDPVVVVPRASSHAREAARMAMLEERRRPLSRRDAIAAGIGFAAAPVYAQVGADMPPEMMGRQMLNEMETKTTQMRELTPEELKAKRAKRRKGKAVDPDNNPDAGINMRGRSYVENTKRAMEFNERLNKMSEKEKKEELCEMLGRGCS
mmetsp:Transcript_83320/g.130072  ORF Transcript_83320/g.130072 Transcript_83320/m.130072 type:complete len:195 (+) Transcript_83320:37-621(+)